MAYILITGSSGFIGSNLLKYIEKNHSDQVRNIVLLSNSSSSKFITISHSDYRFSPGDFTEKGITEIEAVIHLGAFTPKESSTVNLLDENYNNVSNTIFLLRNLPSKPKKFIFASTLDVYQPTKEIIDELTYTLPATFYGQCKLFCERVVLQFCESNSIIPQVLRLGHIYGPGEEAYNKLIPQTIKNILNDKDPVIYSNGEEKRSYLHISDCVNAIWNAMKLNNFAGPVNIVSSKAYSVKYIMQALVNISEKKVKVDILNKTNQGHDMVFNNQKMTEHLSTEKVELLEGLKEEFNLFNKEKK